MSQSTLRLQSTHGVTVLRDRAHYVSDGVYTLGSLGCAVCGQLFPLGTSAAQHAVCSNCHCAHTPQQRDDDDDDGSVVAANAGGRARGARARGLATRAAASTSSNAAVVCKAALLFTAAELATAARRASMHDNNDNDDDNDDEVASTHRRRRDRDADASVDTAAAAAATTAGAALPASRRAGTTAVDHRVIEDAFCASCGVHRPCRTYARQTRSADEGQTIFYQCTVCRAEWQENT